MDAIPIRKRRPRQSKAAGTPSGGKSATAARPRRLAGRIPGAVGALAVFIAAFLLDPAAVANLLAACLAGHEGLPARMAAFGSLLLLLCMIAAVLYRPADAPPAKPHKRAARPAARKVSQNDHTDAGDIGPPAKTAPGKASTGKTSAGKRRSRKGPGAATGQD
jgi:hypothetical protein